MLDEAGNFRPPAGPFWGGGGPKGPVRPRETRHLPGYTHLRASARRGTELALGEWTSRHRKPIDARAAFGVARNRVDRQDVCHGERWCTEPGRARKTSKEFGG